jgi:RNA ligase
MEPNLIKYPRTHHIQGSRLQPGDEDLCSVPFSSIAHHHVVVEEKVDGANAAIRFDAQGQLLLQSRGHYLTGGEREKHFNLFKQWAYTHAGAFWDILGDRYLLYGEWLYAKHTVFYDALPHYFLEYDVLDVQTQHFLSTDRRQALLAGVPILAVPVLFTGKLQSHKQFTTFLRKSNYIQPGHLGRFQSLCQDRGLDVDRALKQTDPCELMEGLYLKVEEDGIVKARYKYIRASFLTTML